MRRPIFTHADGVMREYINDGNLHDRRQTHGWTRIIAEDEEARAERTDFANGQAVQDGTHGVLADAEMEIAPTIIVGFKVTRAIEGETGFGGRRQVCRASNQPG